MSYTQIKIKSEYRDKLSTLAGGERRSMANMVEVLIDDALTQKQGYTASENDSQGNKGGGQK